MYKVILNTELIPSKTLFPKTKIFKHMQGWQIIASRLQGRLEKYESQGNTIVIVYAARTLASALKDAQYISNKLKQDCVAVRIKKDNAIVLQTLCGMYPEIYDGFNNEYFKVPTEI